MNTIEMLCSVDISYLVILVCEEVYTTTDKHKTIQYQTLGDVSL
jgi:hypothetical protein